jgi:hypothetical protein
MPMVTVIRTLPAVAPQRSVSAPCLRSRRNGRAPPPPSQCARAGGTRAEDLREPESSPAGPFKSGGPRKTSARVSILRVRVEDYSLRVRMNCAAPESLSGPTHRVAACPAPEPVRRFGPSRTSSKPTALHSSLAGARSGRRSDVAARAHSARAQSARAHSRTRTLG